MKTTVHYLAIVPLIFAVSSCQNQQANRSNGSDDGYQEYGYVPSDASAQPSNNPYATDTYGSYQQSADKDNVNSAPSGSYTSSGSGTQMPSYQDSVSPMPSYNPAPAAPPSSTGLAQSHIVSQGENLYRISKIYGSSVEGIKSANGLNSNIIHPGDVLNIP